MTLPLRSFGYMILGRDLQTLMQQKLVLSTLLIITSLACSLTLPSVPAPTATLNPPTEQFTLPAPTETASVIPTYPFTDTPAPSETSTPLPSDTPLPTVESLEAVVTATRLSCRYGPGPDYLYLFAYRAGANVKLLGRVDADNWIWVLVENKIPCWVNSSFLAVEGDIRYLPVVYPDIAKLPITPYYPATDVLNAQRNYQNNQIIVSWVEVPVSPGDYEDETMQTYIIEVWRCQSGQLIFEPLATRSVFIGFFDEPGCSEPSHGRVWVQDKHGFAGPAEIPWPPHLVP